MFPENSGPVRPRRLRIGIDAHAIGQRRTGNERFIANLIPALRAVCDHDLVLYFSGHAEASGWKGLHRTEVRVLRPSRAMLRVPFSLPFRARRDRLDVLLVQYHGPPVTGTPLVVVVHDVAFAVHPEFFDRGTRAYMSTLVPATIRKAAGVVTVSEFSAAELARVYGTPPAKITVAHNGVDPVFFERSAKPSPVEPPFFLAIGNLQPRKNLATLVRAYRLLLEDHPGIEQRLVLAGQEWFASESLYRETEDLRRDGRIVFTGYVSDDELVGLLQRATAFAFPSVYEGFGLPVVEAMATGLPVAVADIEVMREVAGEDAIRVPAHDVEAWAGVLLRLATDERLRRSMAGRGRERVARFTWESSARAILGALERAACPEGAAPSE